MPRRRTASGHTYSVFVDTIMPEGARITQMVYQNGSKFGAQLALAQAIVDNPLAWRIDFRRDMRLLVRVYLERPV
jgi:hypothetical protein